MECPAPHPQSDHQQRSEEATNMRWNVPTPSAVLDIPMTDSATVVIRRHGRPDGPRLLFSHGCGFAADLYLPYWSLLLDRFDLFICDIRSHGWNPLADRRHQNFAYFIEDLETILRAYPNNW
jgi:pimeloyl-ACP methyl ester carboxylesterase